MGEGYRVREDGFAFWALVGALVVLGVAGVAVAGVVSGGRWDAVRGKGEAGVFRFEERVCSGVGQNRSCRWTGTFSAERGGSRGGVELVGGDVEGAQGKTVPAVDTGSGKEVFDPGISWTVMIGPAAWGIGGAALLVAAPVVVVRRRRKAG